MAVEDQEYSEFGNIEIDGAASAHVGAWWADFGEKLYSVRNNGAVVSYGTKCDNIETGTKCGGDELNYEMWQW